MATVHKLRTSLAEPVGAQRIRGRCPPKVVPAYILKVKRRDKAHHAGLEQGREEEKRRQHQKAVAAKLVELTQAAFVGEIDGIAFIVRASKDNHRVGVSGCFEWPEREDDRKVLFDAFEDLRDALY